MAAAGQTSAGGRGRRSPVGRRHGARAKKKKHHPGCFLAAAPARGRGRRSPVGLPFARGRSKKKPGCAFFFLLWPRRKVAAPNGAQQENNTLHTRGPGTTAKTTLETNDTGHEQKGATTKNKKHPGHISSCRLDTGPHGQSIRNGDGVCSGERQVPLDFRLLMEHNTVETLALSAAASFFLC